MHRLAHFDDARSARAGIRRLTDQRAYEAAAAACADDLLSWYGRLVASREIVFPLGWKHDGSVPPGVIGSHIAEAGREWIPPVSARTGEGWTVGLPLAVMTEHHARRYEQMFAAEMPLQREFLAGALGGRPVEDVASPVVS